MVPYYPMLLLDEAHQYLPEAEINQLCTVIRHIGVTLWFLSNTPSMLPNAVLRLADNIFVTPMPSDEDIHYVVASGLADRETVTAFARNMPDHHVLLLSAKSGASSNFPLVIKVPDFGLPISGRTRSQWEALLPASAAETPI